MIEDVPEIIGEPKDGKAFINQRVLARYGENNDVYLSLNSETTSFADLLKLRKQSQDSLELEKELTGEGYLFANVGISALILLKYKDENYLLTTKAERVDRANPDAVAKLLSGYVPANMMGLPEESMKRKIAQEFLPMTNGKVLPGRLNELGHIIMLEQPYKSDNLNDSTKALSYSTEMNYLLVSGNDFILPGTKRGKISLQDLTSKVHEFGTHTEFHAAADTNSGQLIFRYTITLPLSADLSLHHSEEKLRQGTSFLDIYFHGEGILLMHLDNKLKLTENVYTLTKGKLIPYKLPVTLTEAFAPKTNGISSQGSISLTDYLGKKF